MSLSDISRVPWLGRLIFSLWRWDARHKLRRIGPWLTPSDTILEAGSGLGSVILELTKTGYTVLGLDIADHSFHPELKPVIYDGKRFPFPDHSFSSVLLLTVLHHTPDPEHILREAARVGHQVIVIEDIYRNTLQRRATMALDSLANLEWTGHPHNNHSDAEWRKIFHEMGLKVINFAEWPFLLFFRQALYILRKDTDC